MTTGGHVKKRISFAVLLAAVGALALVAAGCGGKKSSSGGGGGGNVTALPASSCNALQYKGDRDPDYLIASDLTLLGGSRAPTVQMHKAIAYGCLTEPCAGPEPEKYYPSGQRTYARVAPSDPNQGAVDAKFMKDKGATSVYILNDKEAYGLGVAKNFKGAAQSLGMKVLGFSAYDPKAPNYQALFTQIKNTNPDAVFIGGLID